MQGAKRNGIVLQLYGCTRKPAAEEEVRNILALLHAAVTTWRSYQILLTCSECDGERGSSQTQNSAGARAPDLCSQLPNIVW